MDYKKIVHTLKEAGNKEKAVFLTRFFKTAKGQYAEGDVFIGIPVPLQRAIARMHPDLDENSLTLLLANGIHEYRLTALIILVDQFKRGNAQTRDHIYQYYLSKTKRINNWDLVDLSAPKILGEYLLTKPKERKVLYQLVKSKDLWERRIAIVATYTFIRHNEFTDTLKLAKLLLTDTHDLIHKAIGWMLREIGKRDRKVLHEFLGLYAYTMPRTALRYAIEHLTREERSAYLSQRSKT